MTEKRFTVHIKWFNYEKTEGEIELKDNGIPLLISEDIDDVRWIKELLNELYDDNKHLKQREEQLLTEIEDFQELLKQNDDVCHDRVIKLIDDKLAEYNPLNALLTVKIPKDCPYNHSCMENNSHNVMVMSKYNILEELKKELKE